MATVEFLDGNQKPLKLAPSEHLKRATDAAMHWATENSLDVKFALEGVDRLYIHLGGIRLNNWVHLKLITEGDTHAILEQLDYARFEYRRSASGYGKFDR
jgi:hypothetical protein